MYAKLFESSRHYLGVSPPTVVWRLPQRQMVLAFARRMPSVRCQEMRRLCSGLRATGATLCQRNDLPTASYFFLPPAAELRPSTNRRDRYRVQHYVAPGKARRRGGGFVLLLEIGFRVRFLLPRFAPRIR